MRRYHSIMLCLVFLSGCASPVVHKINFSHDYTPTMVNRVAILNINKGSDVAINADVVVDKFTAAMVGSRFKIVDRADLKKIIEGAKFQHTASGIINNTNQQRTQQLDA